MVWLLVVLEVFFSHAQDFESKNDRTLLTSTMDVINYDQDELKNDLGDRDVRC